MVRNHGEVVLAGLLHLDRVELLEPERDLHQVVVLCETRKEDMRVVDPKLRRVEPIWTVIDDVLCRKA